MTRSKGDRVPVLLRLERPTLAALKAYRVERGLDGLPAVIEELHALRGDRDKEMQVLRDQMTRLKDDLEAQKSLVRELRRNSKRAAAVKAAGAIVPPIEAMDLPSDLRRIAAEAARGKAHRVSLVQQACGIKTLSPIVQDALGKYGKARLLEVLGA